MASHETYFDVYDDYLLRALAAGAAKIELRPCKLPDFPEDTRCGTYEVFENRAARTGRKIPLRIVVIPANTPQRQPDGMKGRECEEEMMVKLIETGTTERLDTSCVTRMERPLSCSACLNSKVRILN